MPIFSRATVCCLIVWSAVIYAYGFGQSWLHNQDYDTQQRIDEYESFRQGVYPTKRLEPGLPVGTKVPYTVYPPYALPMFVPYFEPFGMIQGRIVIQVLSIAALAAIAAYGSKLLRPAGIDAAIVGALAAVAIPGNGTGLAAGQFSIICAGCVLLQMLLLDHGRPLAAGVCWSLAMLKPQIGLSFAALFLVRREWRGLAVGLAILMGLSLTACWWTDVSPRAVVDHWMFRMNTRFATTTSVSGYFADAMGLNARVIHVGVAVLILLVPLVALRSPRLSIQPDTLTVAAGASLFSSVLLYHRAYDRIMMFPLLFFALAAAARRPKAANLGIAATLCLSLWLPEKILPEIPLLFLLRPVVWTACAAAMFVRHTWANAAGDESHPANEVA